MRPEVWEARSITRSHPKGKPNRSVDQKRVKVRITIDANPDAAVQTEDRLCG